MEFYNLANKQNQVKDQNPAWVTYMKIINEEKKL